MRHTSLKAILAGSALAVTAFALPFAGGPASAAPQVQGTIRFVAVSTSTAENGPSKDIVIGAIVDHGSDHPVSKNVQKVVLSKGTFEVNAKRFNHAFTEHINRKACTVTGGSFARNLPIIRGTGAYKGITGMLTLRATFLDIGKIVKGTCKLNAQPVAGTTVIQGSGKVAY